MENCPYAGFLSVPSGATVVLTGGNPSPIPSNCEIEFRADVPDHVLTVQFNGLNLVDCDVNLFIEYDDKKVFIINL